MLQQSNLGSPSGKTGEKTNGHADLQVNQQVYDIVICGGGLAGLTLARQLQQTLPSPTILVLDRIPNAAPDSLYKVGESMTEAGAHYLSERLGLTDYFQSSHLNKLGFRFFFGDPTGEFQDRPEFGISRFPAVPSYNVDRGRLESDLRHFNQEAGITLHEGCIVQSIQLAQDDGDHEVVYRQRRHSLTNGPWQRVKARWVVDAMGRRRYLQKQLGLTKALPRPCSAAWFRLPGRIDVDEWVQPNAASWHERVPGRIRYYSTNHLMGTGYWVWLIPLPTGNTSVGIVADNEFHPFDSYNTYERALQWLQTYESVLASHIEGVTPLDFRCMHQYTYSSHQVFSTQRWACVGDAGFFSDPLYAPATDFIALSNSMTTDLIQLDFANQLTEETVTSYNQTILALNDAITQNIQIGYPLFAQPGVMAAKVIWDTAAGWGLFAPQIYNAIYKDPEVNLRIRKVKAGYYFLTQQMQRLFIDWGAQSNQGCSFDFIDFLHIPLLRDLRERNLHSGKPVAELVDDHTRNMEQIEELALAFFLVAFEDVMPEHLPHLLSYNWLNAWRVTLQPSQWQKDGLYTPRTPARDTQPTYEHIRDLFRFEQETRVVA